MNGFQTHQSPPWDPAPEDTAAVLINAPIAVCTVTGNPVAPPYETATFDGSASYSPLDLTIIGEEWSLVAAPDGNGVALSGRTGFTTSLTPQLAGEYWVELSVIDERGVRSEEPCVIVVDAIPVSTVQVETFWSHRGENMDLHVVRPGGTPRTSDDCYVDNCVDGLPWYSPGTFAHNAQILLHDDEGVGPELIQFDTNEDGEFQVFVHDNPDFERNEPTDLTVSIILNGDKVFNETRRILGEDTDTFFATVNPVTGVVNPLR